jgi:hypothetical protein
VNKDSQVNHSNLYSVTYEDETDFHYFNDMDDKVFLMVDILDGSGLYPNIAVCWDMDGEFLPFIIMKIGSNDWEFVISFENHMLEAYLVGSIKDRKGVVGYIVNGDYFLFGIESSNNVVTERNYHPLYNGECVSRDDTTNAEGSNYLLGLGYETSGYVLANNKINPDSKGIHSIITNINDLETVLIKNNIDNSIQ